MPAPPLTGRRHKVEAQASADVVAVGENILEPVKPALVEAKKSGPVMVVALRAGFFERVRRAPGDKFMIPDIALLGKWMKLV